MTQWYFEGPDGQPSGPIDEQALIARHREGLLSAQTRVWRDGMSDWQTWGDVVGTVPGADPSPGVPDGPGAPQASAGQPPASRPSPPSAAPVQGAPVVHAGFWKRLAAAIIDGLVMACLGCVLVAPLSTALDASSLLYGSLGDNPFTTVASWASSMTSSLLSLAPACIYHGWMTSSPLQATLGKLAVGIKVVRGDGARVDFWRGFLRHLAYGVIALVTCGIGLLVSAAMVGMSARKQAIHDRICDTLVVDKYAFTPEHGRQQTMIGTTALAVLMVFGLLALAGAVALGFSLAALIGNAR